MTRTKTARLIPDAVYPGMCRVRWPDGRVSDMVNLTRANDAIACYGETVERQRRGRHSHRNDRQGIFSMAFWPKQNSSRLRRSIVTAITSATQATTPYRYADLSSPRNLNAACMVDDWLHWRRSERRLVFARPMPQNIFR